jgi:hypothetical protein
VKQNSFVLSHQLLPIQCFKSFSTNGATKVAYDIY